ncbi:MAG: restriction endonuclease subunit S [Bacteroides sp.]|nr:restriction endonuclease subunit S [Bacteroides sp.]
MSEWKEYKLGEITTEIGDGIHGTPNYSEDGEFYFINGNNISNGKIMIKGDTKRVNRIEFEKYKKSLSNRTILMSINGTIGNVGFYNDEKCILGKSACYFNLKDNVDKNFVYYTFLTDDFQSHLLNIATGTTIQNVPLKGLRESIILLPPLDEQKRIASILTSIDDKIDLLHRENATLEVMAETLFRQWLIEEAKDDWDEMPLTKIANFTNGLACQKYPPKNDIEKLPVLKIRELANGISSDSDYATTEVANEYIVHAGDVIFAWSASLMVKIWDGEDCVLNQHLFKVTSESFPKWFYYCWCQYHLNEFIAIAQSHATTMGHIKRGDLENTMVLVPSNDELKVMSDQFDCIIQKLENNNKEICTLIQTRDNLLPKLMNREIIIHG